MFEKIKYLRNDQAIWLLVGTVFLCVLLVLIAVFNHDKEKPRSPHALVATAFDQALTVKEWKPGMGPKPFMYHPAGFNSLDWRPLPSRHSSSLQWSPDARLTPPNSGSRFNNSGIAQGPG